MNKEIKDFHKLSKVLNDLLNTTCKPISTIREKLHLIIENS